MAQKHDSEYEFYRLTVHVLIRSIISLKTVVFRSIVLKMAEFFSAESFTIKKFYFT